jgi:hypothetical protein
MNDITRYDEDDGFDGSIAGGQLIKGTIARWTETNKWTDRDGLPLPEVLLALACTEAVQHWKNKKQAEPPITTKPLPDVTALNARVPQETWEIGLNGQPKPPYTHVYVVYLIDPADGSIFTYLNNTVGARIAWEKLRERVITIRALRGVRCIPVVRLEQRPMRTGFGMKNRPEFKIIDWRVLGGDGGDIAGPSTPQLTGPVAAEIKTETKPETKSETPTTGAAAKTIDALEKVTLPTAAEELADEIPW